MIDVHVRLPSRSIAIARFNPDYGWGSDLFLSLLGSRLRCPDCIEIAGNRAYRADIHILKIRRQMILSRLENLDVQIGQWVYSGREGHGRGEKSDFCN
ncbi:hypothetical protein N7470_001090 [Penicillium chermesinum]|nr:hypothetical protein N7470_001090 [Penicillium chermesinum]